MSRGWSTALACQGIAFLLCALPWALLWVARGNTLHENRHWRSAKSIAGRA